MLTRRQIIQSTAFTAAAMTTPGLFAEELARTAKMTEGPFYPDHMPLDTDNDLLLINEAATPDLCEITYLTGRVLSKTGPPIRNAFVEIWQCDANGVYLHTKSSNSKKRDSNYQGYGRFLTDSKGRYAFRTIKPVRYPGRTPHIHFGVSKQGKRILTTQLLINGDPRNQKDGLFKRIKDPAAQKTVMADFLPIKGSKIGELAAEWDMVLGHTVEELEDGTFGGGLADKLYKRKG
jgi:protocatechuate 3,4-dioxygenase beta subunit